MIVMNTYVKSKERHMVVKKYFSIVALVLCVAIPSIPLYSQPALIASWSFNETGADSSGNGYHAALKGNAAYSDDAAKGSHIRLV